MHGVVLDRNCDNYPEILHKFYTAPYVAGSEILIEKIENSMIIPSALRTQMQWRIQKLSEYRTFNTQCGSWAI